MTADLTATTASDPLRHLLQVFDTASTGEGDVAAGANVLAAQCISLANLYPPGACLTTEGGQRLPVGMSFLNYPQALYSAMAFRLDHRQPASTTILYPWHPRQREWVALLQKLEPRCPGLTQSARPLFGTLIFGLSQLSRIQSGEKRRWTDIGAFELAKFLVARMVQCRDQIAQRAELAQLWDWAIKLIPKLEAGPLSDRQLCRKTSRLNIGDCRQALDLIGRFGLARRGGDGKWELMLPVAQAVERLRQPCIDI